MNNKRKPVTIPRSKAFIHQNGFCYYCNQPMWLKEPEKFSNKHNLTLSQTNLLKCTGEHLIAHQNGGTSAQDNIVAACWFCNSRRHRPKVALSPDRFKKFIQKLIKKNRWHNFRLTT